MSNIFNDLHMIQSFELILEILKVHNYILSDLADNNGLVSPDYQDIVDLENELGKLRKGITGNTDKLEDSKID